MGLALAGPVLSFFYPALRKLQTLIRILKKQNSYICRMVNRIISLLLGLIFILFAYFQLNDLDPALWVPIYLVAAGLCIASWFSLRNLWVSIGATVAFIVGAIVYWPDQWEGVSLDGGYTVNIEEARESLGLAICAAATIYLAVLAYRDRKSAPK